MSDGVDIHDVIENTSGVLLDTAEGFSHEQGNFNAATFAKRFGLGTDILLALVKEHPVTALVGVAAGVAAVALLGPVIEVAAVGTLFGASLLPGLAALEGSTAGALLQAAIQAGIQFAIKEGAKRAIEEVDNVLGAVQFPFANGLKFAGANYNFLASDPRFTSTGLNVITSTVDPSADVNETTIGRLPSAPSDGKPGQLDVLLPASQLLTFQRGSVSQLVSNFSVGTTSSFTAFLADAGKNRTGSLKLNLDTDIAKLIAKDQSTVDLGILPLRTGVADLKTSISKSGATEIDVVDPNGGVKGDVTVDVGGDGNSVIASSLANASIILGTGIDTLLHLGAGSTIDVGGNFDPNAGHATAQYELSVTKRTLVIGASNSDSISLTGNGFVQTGGTIDGTPGNTSLIVANSVGQTVNGGTGNNIIIGAGTNDTLNASQSGQKLIALGQSGDVLNGQTSSQSGLDKLIAVAGKVVGGNVSNSGNDILNAGVGNNIMIGEGVDTTFNIDTTNNASPIDVVWGTGGKDTINVTGGATVYVVDAPDATLASVKNLNVQKLYQELISKIAIVTQIFGKGPEAPTSGPAIIAINPMPNEKLVVDGQQITTGQGGPSRSTIVDFVSITGEVENLAGPVVGLAPGDFGISISDPNGTTPQVSLTDFQNQASPNASGGSGGGTDPSVIDQSTISGFDISDTLLSISAATITQFSASDTLIADNGADTLIDQGSNDTLIGNVAGSTLIGNSGNPQFDEKGTTVAYAANGVTVDLSAGTASAAGATATDTLIGIQNAEALGTNDALIAGGNTLTLAAEGSDDTLIGGSGTTTLVSSVIGSTLVAGSGTTVADYTNPGSGGDIVVNLATQTATISGSSVSDTLIGIQVAEVSNEFSGVSDTLIGGTGNDTLTAAGFFGTVIGGSGNDTLIVTGQSNTLVGGGGNDLLSATSSAGFDTLIAGTGTDTLSSAGAENLLIGGSGRDVLTSTGFSNLVAGTAADTLISTGFDDTLVGNALGSTLIGQAGKDTVAVYNANNLTVDLNTGTATVNGSSSSDTLTNIAIVQASGNNDTLIGGAGTTTLTASGSASVLFGGSGTTDILAQGSGDTATGGSGVTTISNSGSANTLIGGSGKTTLETGVGGNTLIAGVGPTTAVYNDDGDVVDLATETASHDGNPSDTLVGITSAAVVGQHSTLIGGGAGDVLSAVSAEGSDDTLIAGSGDETLTSAGLNSFINTGNTLIAGSGNDTLSSSGNGDVLLAGDGASELLSSDGRGNSLIAGSGIDTLTSTGSNDTLFGNGAGSTLDGSGGSAAIAAYAANNVIVNLAAGTAGVNGSGVTDTLLSISAAAALGTNDTLIDGDGGSTLISNANGNTLEGGTGKTVASYAANNLTVNLASAIAGIIGSGLSDTLIGIHAASVSGSNNRLIGDSGTDVLSATGTGNTLSGGAGNDTLTAGGTNNVLIADGSADVLTVNFGTGNILLAGAGSDTLTSSGGTADTLIAGSGSDTLTSSGTGDSLVAGSAADVLSSTGTNNTLFSGTGVSTLSSSGSGDTLFGSGVGSTLNATGFGASVVYSIDNVTVDLATGTAGVNGSSVADSLSGFNTAAVLGSNDTLIDGNSGSTLISSAGGNTLVGGTGQTTAAYANNNLAVNLATGTAGVNGASASDTLIGIHAVAVSGSNDTVTGDSGTDILSSSGTSNTLIAGSGVDTLMSTGTDDTLFGNLMGSALEETEIFTGQGSQQGTGTIAVYTADNATINLLTETAQANGASVSDQLSGGISTVEALGSNDTLIGAASVSTLISNAGSNTLIGQVGAETVALYSNDNLTVDLVLGTAAVNGAGVADTLIGIMAADALGNNDTLIGAGTGDTLTAGNASDVVAYAVNNLSINLVALALGSDQNGNTVVAGTAGVNGTNAEDRLVNVSNVLVSGADDSVTGGMTSDSMTAAGSNDILIAGAVSDVLIASGGDDTLAGNFTGSTLEATQTAVGTVALYTQDGATVDLGSGTASSVLSTATDTLIRISNVSVTGAFDTVLAGSGVDTLSSSGSFNSLMGGSGNDVLISSGQNDTLIAGSGVQTLTSNGSSNTLIAGSAVDTLISSGRNDMLFGNASNSTLIRSGGVGTTAAYQADNVTIDLNTGTARVNGSIGGDTLSGISDAAVSGSNDTAIAAAGGSVLSASGLNDTLIGGGGADTLSASGSEDTLLAGNGTALLSSSGFNNSLVAGSGADVLSSSGTNDVLRGGAGADTLSSSGFANTLVAGTGADTLVSTGTGDTLFGNGAGSTLIGTGGAGVIAAYAMNDVTVNLASDTATVNGSGVWDTLVGISSVLLSGSNDTVIGGTGTSTIYSDAAGNTLVAGTGQTTVVYTQNNVSVDLATSQATVNGSATSDTLTGITMVEVAGSGDTLVGGAGPDVLSSSGTFNTLIAGSGSETLLSSGVGDSLVAGSGADTIVSSGQSNVLIAGSAADSLVSTGFSDTLVGNAAGSRLDGSAGFGAIADYTLNNVTVNLASATATVNGSGVSDTLVGISLAMASGTNDTLLGGNSVTTLFGNGGGNTLVAGSGQTTAAYVEDNATVNLATRSAEINGSTSVDTLVGITSALVTGTNDTLIGATSGDVLSSAGFDNTLTAGSGDETLSSSGADDTLVGNAAGSTLDGSNGAAAIAAYTLNNVTVDLTTGTAAVNRSGVSDTLIGISSAAALGTGDTLIGGTGPTTLYSDGAGNTLIVGAGSTTAAYAQDHTTVNLATSSATVAGSSTSDTLVGITSALVSGTGDVVIGGSGTESLASDGTSNTLIAGSGVDSLSTTGTGDTLIGGGAADVLLSGGFDNSLVAGTGVESLVSTGFDDTLFGNAAGSTLDGSGGFGAIAAYAQNNVTVDLAAGTTGINGSTVADRLIGIDNATITGAGDTLIGNAGADTLIAIGSNDLVEAGSGADTLVMNSGTNTFFAGAGADTFVVQSAAINSGLNQPQNLIENFNPANGTIDLTQITGVSSFADLSFSTVTFGSQSYLQVTLGSTGQAIMLSGVSASELSANDFVFGQAATGSIPTVAISSEVLADDTGASSNDYVTSDGQVTLTGTASAVSTVAIFDNGQNIGTATISGTNWTFSTDLGAGSHQLVAVGTESDGSTVSSSPAPTVVVDQTIPQPVIMSLVPGQNAGLVLNGSSEANSVVQVFDGTTLVGSTTTNASGTWSLTTGAMTNSLHSFTATATDLAGNTGSSAVVVQYGGSGNDTVNIAATLQASNFVFDAANGDWSVSAPGVTESLTNVEAVVDGVGHRFLLVGAGSQYATIQQAVNAASNGDMILIAPGSYTEKVNIAGKAISLEGYGGATVHGSITESGTLNGALSIDGLAIDATGQQYGVLVSANSTNFAGSVTIDHSSISNAELNGFAYIENGNGSTLTLTDTIGSISILNSLFSGNATQTSGANGRGDILLYGYNGNFTVDGLTIQDPGAGAQKAIQLRGVQTSANTVNVGPYQASGNIALSNLNISGSYSQDLLAFYRYAQLGSFSASGVSLNAAAPWGLFNFDEVGGTIDLSSGITATNLANGAPIAAEQGLSTDSTFVGTSGNDVLVANGGNDMLSGGTGANIYVYSSSGGNDVINDAGTQSELVFTNVASSGVSLSRGSGNDLVVTIVATGKTVTISGQLSGSATGPLKSLNFSDGVVWTAAQINASFSPPAVSITSPAGASNLAAQTITGTVVPNGVATVAGQTVTLTDNGTTLGTATVQANGTFSANVTLPNQGSNAIVATVTDSFGNTGSSAAVVDTLDNIAPMVAITSAAEASNVANQTITGTVTSGGAATVVGQTVTLTDNGTVLGTATVQADGTYSANVTLPNQGTNAIVATVTDSFGNAGTSAAVVDTFDNIPPTVTITSAAEASNNASQTITGTVSSGGAAAVVGQTVTLTDNGTVLGTATVQADGSFSANLTLPNQGSNSIVATVADSYGNTGSSAAVVDTLGSVAPTITGTRAGQSTTSETPINPFSGVTVGDLNVGATDTLTITLSGAGGTLSGTGLSGSNGTYTLSGTASAITNELDALVFTPTAGQPNTSGTTSFTLSDTSGLTTYAGASPLAFFSGFNGANPDDSLVVDSEGNLFGTTRGGGGVNNAGTVFELAKTANGYSDTPTLLDVFTGPNGATPNGSLIIDAAGDLFGTTVNGGTNGLGTVFEITKSGNNFSGVTTLLSFNGTNGANPTSSLLADAAGDLFGTASFGGANNDGAVFELVKNGNSYSSTLIASFDVAGAQPRDSLIMDSSGDLFGTIERGGTSNQGEVFEITKTANGYSSTPTMLAAFNGIDGATPSFSGLTMDAAGNLFGATFFGGTANDGEVYEIVKTANGYDSTPTALASFNGPNGMFPEGKLLIDAAGNLFGTASQGGPNNGGTVFEISKINGAYSSMPTVLATFSGGGDPFGGLIFDAAGNLLGTTPVGGPNGDGMIFELLKKVTSFTTVDSNTTVINSDPAVPPTVTITSAGEASNVAAQTITGAVASGGGSIVGQTVTLTDNGTVLGTATVQAGGAFSVTVTLPNQGTNSIVATVTDSLGLVGTSAAVVDTLDNVPPTVTITSAAEASNVAAQTITGTATSGGLAAVAGQTVALIDNGTTLGTATVQADGTFSANVILPNQGANSIVATVTDSFGNIGSSSAVLDTLDNIPPTVTITSAAEGSRNPNQTITGTLASGGAATVVGQTVILTDNGMTLGTAVVQADGTFSTNVTLPTQGANAIVATATDSFGNTGTSAAVVDTLDNIPPTVLITSAAEASQTAAQTISGTVVSGGAAVVVGQTVTLTDNGEVLGTATVQADGTFSANVALPDLGANAIVATVTDSFGNTGSSAAVVDTLGSVAPTITGTRAGQTTTSETSINPFNGVTVGDLNVGATDTLTITLSGAGGTLSGTGLSGSNGTYTLSGSAATITAELDALVFTPTGGQPNTSGTTSFALSDVSTGYTVPTSYASSPTVLTTYSGLNGFQPNGTLIMDAAGDLFGATYQGLGNFGSVFEIAKTSSGYSSTRTVLATFNNLEIQGRLLMDAAGDLFGTTLGGGANNAGTVFEIAKTGNGYSGTPTTLATFNGTNNGVNPNTGLITDAAGDLFGTTSEGPNRSLGSTVFEIAKTSSGYSSTPTTLASFNNDGTLGFLPQGNLIMDAAGDLFGINENAAFSSGNIFEIAKTGAGYSSTPTVVATFTGADGREPINANLIIDAFGNLFGTTTLGGANNEGTIFELAKTGSGYSSTPTVLFSFDGTHGSEPEGGLIMDAAGDLLGTTAIGGQNNDGTLFELVKTSNGYASTPAVLASFGGLGGAQNGNTSPIGSLTADLDGNLFGTVLQETNPPTAATSAIEFELPALSSSPVATVDRTTTVINSDPPVPPTVAIASAANSSNAEAVAGTITSPDATVAGEALTLTDNGTSIGTATVGSSGSFTVSGTRSAQANNLLSVSVTDSIGDTNNTYLASTDTGQTVIGVQGAAGTANDLDFTGGLTDQNLWFVQSGNDLKIDILGSTSSVTVGGWFSGNASQLQEISAGGLKIDSQVSQLVQAMATYSSNNPGFDPTSSAVSSVPNDSGLQSAVSASWHS